MNFQDQRRENGKRNGRYSLSGRIVSLEFKQEGTFYGHICVLCNKQGTRRYEHFYCYFLVRIQDLSVNVVFAGFWYKNTVKSSGFKERNNMAEISNILLLQFWGFGV